MTTISLIALFSILFLAALIPSLSSITVFTRSICSGFGHGVVVSFGIVTGDIFFILIAIFGVSLLIGMFGNFIFILKFICGSYVIFLATQLWYFRSIPLKSRKLKECSLISSFLTGLLITLSDQKAILFYLGIFPTLFELSKITYSDIGIILGITVIAVGGAKVCYAYMANQVWSLIENSAIIEKMNSSAAAILMLIGITVIISAGIDVLELTHERHN